MFRVMEGREQNLNEKEVSSEGGLSLRGENVGRIEHLINHSEFENLKTMCHYTFQNDTLLR